MSKSIKISLGIIVASLGILAAVLVLGGDEGEPKESTAAEQENRLTPSDSIRLSDGPDTTATLVEFLDFECEACRSVKPVVDQVRTDFEGELEIVIRYMPLHASSVNAAKAAEAANEQGRFDDMYDLLFETQPEWGEQQTAEEDFFFELAERLELDMDEFRAVFEDPATETKIARDQADGEALGVSGTPTFFLDDEKVELKSVDDLLAQIEEAVGR